jgi:hypothetical protein
MILDLQNCLGNVSEDKWLKGGPRRKTSLATAMQQPAMSFSSDGTWITVLFTSESEVLLLTAYTFGSPPTHWDFGGGVAVKGGGGGGGAK